MLNLPPSIMTLIQPFRSIFQYQTWIKAQVLVVGAILAPRKRTVTAALRIVGLAEGRGFAKYHQVLNRAVWSSRQASYVLLTLLLAVLDDDCGPLVFGIDETIERRWGSQITARGIYRDAVRSSGSHFVKASGLRWIALMWLTPIPWAHRVWALPFLTVLAPSERYYEAKKRTAKNLTDWARQMITQLRRWLPHRPLVVVGDNGYAVLDLLQACQSLADPVTMVTRLRLDAALYEPAPAYSGVGRPRLKGVRLPALQSLLTAPDTQWTKLELPWYGDESRPMEITSGTAVWYHPGKPVVPIRWVLVRDPNGAYKPIALLSTDPAYSPTQIVAWFVRRWSIEVTFEETRAHLGIETQRQWSDLAILRTTPALFGLFSWVTLVAHHLQQTHLHRAKSRLVHQAAAYVRRCPCLGPLPSLVGMQRLLACQPITPI